VSPAWPSPNELTGVRHSVSAENDLRLEVAVGRARGFSFVVDERLVIGRDSEGPGRLAGDPELSRHHAEIVRAPSGEFTIKDLSSTNGTFVNGTRLTKPGVLVVGDEIEVGATKLVVRSAPVASAPPRPTVDVRAATVIGDVLETAGHPAETTRHPAEEAQVRTEPESAMGGAPLTVRLTVDFEQATAQLSVHGTGEPIQLALEHGRWRVDDRGL
jgi:pSer/pThr/pTyr-binding forkhead associated (FHA) protein